MTRRECVCECVNARNESWSCYLSVSFLFWTGFFPLYDSCTSSHYLPSAVRRMLWPQSDNISEQTRRRSPARLLTDGHMITSCTRSHKDKRINPPARETLTARACRTSEHATVFSHSTCRSISTNAAGMKTYFRLPRCSC